MKQFRTLLGYELKKICCRKSTWITFMVLICAYLLSVALTWSRTYTYRTQEDGTGDMKSEEWHDSYAQKMARERKNGLSWSGRKIDDALLTEIEKEYSKITVKAEAADGGRAQEYFSKEMERFGLLETALTSVVGDENALVQVLYDNREEHDMLTGKELYKARDINVQKHQAAYGLTEKECGYWRQKEKSLSKPLTYQYAEGVVRLIDMDGIYMVLMLSSVLLAVVVSRIFAEEHQRKLDQLILCSRFGRGQLYFVKIAAGVLFAFFAAVVIAGIMMAVTFTLYGADGFSAAIQLLAGWYSYPLTMGSVLLIMLGICFMSVILTSIFIMVVSEKCSSSMAGMVAVIVTIGAARMIVIPREFRILSQVWNYFPINLLKLGQGFLDVRLVSFGGVKMTSWQFAPILYLVLVILLVLLGKRWYCRYQVQGR